MSFIAIDIEPAGVIVFKELGVFNDGKIQGHSFCPPSPQDMLFGLQETCTEPR